jgi:regulator of sirC expression with transglutaminase-like and TPR domain
MDAIAHLGLLDDEAIGLDTGALELAALDHPDVDLAPYLDRLGLMTDEAMANGATARSAGERASVLAQLLAGRHRFGGDRDTYDDPRNADLIEVMERRLGLPVSLSILYVGIARRIGWEADALNTPGHVLVRLGPAPAAVLIDPFNGGALVEKEQLARLLSHALGGGAVTSAHLQPMSNREVLVRLLMNQATRAERGSDPKRALTLYERITTVAPAQIVGWWERARLEVAGGNVMAGRASLSAMLEMTRDPTLRTHVSAALDALAGPSG